MAENPYNAFTDELLKNAGQVYIQKLEIADMQKKTKLAEEQVNMAKDQQSFAQNMELLKTAMMMEPQQPDPLEQMLKMSQINANLREGKGTNINVYNKDRESTTELYKLLTDQQSKIIGTIKEMKPPGGIDFNGVFSKIQNDLYSMARSKDLKEVTEKEQKLADFLNKDVGFKAAVDHYERTNPGEGIKWEQGVILDASMFAMQLKTMHATAQSLGIPGVFVSPFNYEGK